MVGPHGAQRRKSIGKRKEQPNRKHDAKAKAEMKKKRGSKAMYRGDKAGSPVIRMN